MAKSSIIIDFWSILLLFGTLQGGFFAFTLLLHKKGDKTSNRLLAFLLIIFSLHRTSARSYRQDRCRTAWRLGSTT